MTKLIFFSEGMKIFSDYIGRLLGASFLVAIFIALLVMNFSMDIYSVSGVFKSIGLFFFFCLAMYAYGTSSYIFLRDISNELKIKNNIPVTDKMTFKSIFINKANAFEILISFAMVGLLVPVIAYSAIVTADSVISAIH